MEVVSVTRRVVSGSLTLMARPPLDMGGVCHSVQFGHKQFENPSKIPIVVTVKAKGYPQLEYILHLFLKITISVQSLTC